MNRVPAGRRNGGFSLLPFLTAALVIILTFFGLFGYLSREYRRKIEQQSLNQLRQLVEMAYNAIHPHLVDYHWLRLSKTEAIEEIRKTLRHMTFYEEEGWNYIFMSSYEGVFLVQTIYPEQEMTNQWDLQDSRGLYIVRELVAMAKEKNESGGFVTYFYPAPGETEPQEKVSFVMGIPEIDCYIGTGRYMGRLRREQQRFYRLTILLGFLFMLLFLGLILLALRVLSRQNRALSREVAERRHSEAALRNKETQLRTVLDTMPEMVWLKDLTGTYLTCNKRFSQFLDSPEEEIIGRTTGDYFPPDELARITALDEETLSTGGPLCYEEVLFFRSLGKGVDCETTKTPLYHQDGTLAGILGLSRDISDRKKQERELSRLRHYLINIIDSMPSRLIGIDADLIITQWNRGAEEAHSIKAAEAVGRPLKEIIPWLALDESLLNKVLNSPGEAVSFTKTRRGNGPVEHLAVTVYPLTGDQDRGAVIMIDDISGKVRLEEMMVQSEKMLSVGGLAAGMAHEINNPLAGMMQTAEVLARRLGDKTLKANIRAAEEAGLSLEALERYLKSRGIDTMTRDILESGSRAALIIKNMLSFSRKSDSAKSTHSIPHLMDTMVELARTDYDLGRQFDFKSIEIVREYAPDVPSVPCDGNQIQQVFFNLLKNGAEAMHSHFSREKRIGRETTAPRFILRIFSEKDSKKLTVEVEDNGPGMEDSVRRRVFEPFYTTKPVGLGTGLGLSVSYFIITETHGGTMTLESSPGQGARFVINLPLQEKEAR